MAIWYYSFPMKSLELALKAARERKSPLTGFVHASSHPDYPRDTIPTYENFCYALALCRTKIADNVLEAKAVLDRLFAFQTEAGLPVNLHEYPACHSRKQMARLAPIAHFLLRDFHSVLGDGLTKSLQHVASFLSPPETDVDCLIHSQITGSPPIFHLWNQEAACFVGPQKYREGEPEVTLLDLIMGEWLGVYSKRALEAGAVHLQGSLIFPGMITLVPPPAAWDRRFWGSPEKTHSALFHTTGLLKQEGLVELPEQPVHDTFELRLFFDRHDKLSVSVADSKANTFQLGEKIVVISDTETFEICFSLVEGQGKFWGHLHFGKRPEESGSATSLQLGLRTVYREARCLIEVEWRKL